MVALETRQLHNRPFLMDGHVFQRFSCIVILDSLVTVFIIFVLCLFLVRVGAG